jgi:hypothetical protein
MRKISKVSSTIVHPIGKKKLKKIHVIKWHHTLMTTENTKPPDNKERRRSNWL